MKDINQKILSGMAGVITFIAFVGVAQISVPVSLILGAGVGLGISQIKNFGSSKEEPKRIPEIKVTVLPDGEDLKEMMNEAYLDLLDIQKGYRNAKHPLVKANAEKLFHSGVKIFEHLKKNPKKIKQARRYLTYYLDTAAAIMNKYTTIQDTRLDTVETQKVHDDTNRALLTLNEAFNRQFIKLMQNEMMEIEAEVKVLEDILKTED